MINYSYAADLLDEGKAKDFLITDGVVTVTGTSYTVTDDTITITNAELEAEKFELGQSLCSSRQIQFGSCESGYVEFTMHGSVSSLKGTILTVYIIPGGDASKMLQVGVFKVAEQKSSKDHTKHTITAYDAMYDILNANVASWYNSLLPDDETSVTVLQFRTSLLSYLGITEEAVSLANDDKYIRRTLKIVKEDGSLNALSGADMIKAVCQINGVFGTITNENKFRYVELAQTISSDADTTDIPLSDCLDISDDEAVYPFRILTVKSQKATANKAWGIIVGPRNNYTISNNLLIKDYSKNELGDLANDLFNVTDGHEYTPFTMTAAGNPLHEVGDPIKVYKPDGTFFYSYILERRLTGVQAWLDVYSANGSPVWESDLNSTSEKLQAANISSSGGGDYSSSFNFPEVIRNIGFRLLDEPSNVSVEYS